MDKFGKWPDPEVIPVAQPVWRLKCPELGRLKETAPSFFAIWYTIYHINLNMERSAVHAGYLFINPDDVA